MAIVVWLVFYNLMKGESRTGCLEKSGEVVHDAHDHHATFMGDQSCRICDTIKDIVQCFFDPQRIRCHSLEHNKTLDQVKGEVLLWCAPVSKNLGCKTIP